MQEIKQDAQILQPTFWQLARPGPWALYRVSRAAVCRHSQTLGGRTNDEGNHACAIATGGLEALDQLLDLPDLNVLLSLVGLLLLGRHVDDRV